METGLYRPDTSYISQITYFRLEFEGVLPKPAAKLTSTHQREGVMSNVPPHFLLLSCCLSFKTEVTAWTLWSISNLEIFHITVLCTCAPFTADLPSSISDTACDKSQQAFEALDSLE